MTWKEAIEMKGLTVNAGKTKIMICSTGLDLLQSSGKFPCIVCCTGVGSSSIFCNGCKHWVFIMAQFSTSPLLFIIVFEACHESSALGSPGKTSVPMTLLSSLNHWRNVLGVLEKSNRRERTESKCRKDKDHDLWYGPGPPAELG